LQRSLRRPHLPGHVAGQAERHTPGPTWWVRRGSRLRQLPESGLPGHRCSRFSLDLLKKCLKGEVLWFVKRPLLLTVRSFVTLYPVARVSAAGSRHWTLLSLGKLQSLLQHTHPDLLHKI